MLLIHWLKINILFLKKIIALHSSDDDFESVVEGVGGTVSYTTLDNKIAQFTFNK